MLVFSLDNVILLGDFNTSRLMYYIFRREVLFHGKLNHITTVLMTLIVQLN